MAPVPFFVFEVFRSIDGIILWYWDLMGKDVLWFEVLFGLLNIKRISILV